MNNRLRPAPIIAVRRLTPPESAGRDWTFTHDFLAMMLGTDRPTLSLAAGILQKKQIIKCTRGAVQILSRAKLEDRTCECYGVVQRYNREIGLK